MKFRPSSGLVVALRVCAQAGTNIQPDRQSSRPGPGRAVIQAARLTSLPIAPLKGQIIRLRAPGPPILVSLSWGADYATTKQDGLVWTGSTEERVGFDDRPTPEGRDTVLESVLQVLPYLEDAELVQQTACLRPIAPDGLPILGALPGAEGAVVATGAGRNGIQLGPAMGRSAAGPGAWQRPGRGPELCRPPAFYIRFDVTPN